MTDLAEHVVVDWAAIETVAADQLRRLLEISISLSETLDLTQLLRRVLDTSRELTDSASASILLLDEKTQELHFVAATGVSHPGDVVVPLSGSVAGWVVRNGRPILLNDAQTDERHFTGVDVSTSYLTHSLLAVPLVTKGRVIGVLETINKRGDQDYSEQDITLLQVLAAQAGVAIENARLFQQTDLIGEIMHELKTPLMALIIATDLLATPKLPAERQLETVLLLQKEARRLVSMTQNFLDLVRLEAGQMRLERNPVDMAELIDAVIALQQSTASSAGITVETAVDQPPLEVVGDANRLRQVLINLISNAIKYNRAGGRVTVRAALEDDEVVITVADDGPGIAPENLPHLFERFYRVPDSEGFTEGSGLGLPIARRIVEQHGGRVEVASELGVGTTFTVYLPRRDGLEETAVGS